MSPTNQALEARVDLLAIVVQELGRALSPAQAAQVARAVRQRVSALAQQHSDAAGDEALTADLIPLLAALG